MRTPSGIVFIAALALSGLLAGCYPNPQPAGLTPIPTLAPGPTLALRPAANVPPSAASAPTSAAPAPAPAATVPPVPAPTAAAPAPALATAAPAATLAPTTAASSPPAAALAQGNSAQGATLFAQNCAGCHGDQAQGGRGPALRKSGYIQGRADKDLFDTIARGRPGTSMPAWLQANGGRLSEQQINDVVAFLRTLQ